MNKVFKFGLDPKAMEFKFWGMVDIMMIYCNISLLEKDLFLKKN